MILYQYLISVKVDVFCTLIRVFKIKVTIYFEIVTVLVLMILLEIDLLKLSDSKIGCN